MTAHVLTPQISPSLMIASEIPFLSFSAYHIKFAHQRLVTISQPDIRNICLHWPLWVAFANWENRKRDRHLPCWYRYQQHQEDTNNSLSNVVLSPFQNHFVWLNCGRVLLVNSGAICISVIQGIKQSIYVFLQSTYMSSNTIFLQQWFLRTINIMYLQIIIQCTPLWNETVVGHPYSN